MIRRKKSKREIGDRGERWFGFHYDTERTIYGYVCCVYVKKGKLRKLSDKLKFESYHQWKQYIINKYKCFELDTLIEFSRYLNQRIRSVKPGYEFNSITAAAIMSWVVTKLMEDFIEVEMAVKSNIICSMVTVIVTAAIVWAIVNLWYKCFWNNNTEENFYKDYKEIIDEIIEERKKMKIL